MTRAINHRMIAYGKYDGQNPGPVVDLYGITRLLNRLERVFAECFFFLGAIN